MKTNTADAVANDVPAGFVPALQRIGITAGLALGFCLLALFMADEASASENRSDQKEHAAEASLDDVTQSVADKVLKPITDKVAGLDTAKAAPVSDSAAEATRPVINAAAPVTETVGKATGPVVKATEPVVKPAVKAAALITRPVLSSALTLTDPVLETASSTLKPVTGPVLEVSGPVVTPIVEAIGGEQAIEDLGVGPVESSTGADDESATVGDESNGVRSSVADATTVPANAGDHGGSVSSDAASDSPEPTVPFSPAGNSPVTTNSTASPGGSHHSDSSTVYESAQVRDGSIHYRGPPATETVAEWWSFDGRNHPS